MTTDQKPISVIVSDLHMGAADEYDDFVHGNREFPSFIDELTQSEDGRRGRIELLINGDFLELAQVNPDVYRLGSAEFWCSEDESLLKLEPILEGHQDVFAAITRFQNSNNRCTLFAGNHDVELYWPKVQTRLRRAAGDVGIELGETWYSRYGGRLRVSHGHMFDPANSFANWANPMKLGPGGIMRLEMCPGTMFMVKFVNWMEHEYPFADNIHPNWRLATVLWKEARDGFALAAWLFARFAARHPRFLLGAEKDVSAMGDWVVASIQSNQERRRDVAQLWHETYDVAIEPAKLVDTLATPEDVERFITDVMARVSPERWLPVFDGIRPDTLAIAKSGMWDANLQLHEEAIAQWKNNGAQIVTIGHTHDADTFVDQGHEYYNTGSWTRSLPWSMEQELTLERLKDESWFPFDLRYLRVELQSDGTLASAFESRGVSS
jgi:UDP-2,3-diacylglucosamine pyrophosphatase LpxH